MVALTPKSKPAIKRKISLKRFLAIDTETTGLALKHGCRAFAVSACDQDGEVFYWQTEVNPHNRSVTWDRAVLEKILKKILSYDTLVFFNFSFDVKSLAFMFEDHKDLLKKFCKHITTCCLHDTGVMAHIFDSKGPKTLKELSILHLEMLDDDEGDLDTLIKSLRDRPEIQKWKWDTAKKGHRNFPGATKNFHKMDMWLARAWAKKQNLPKDHNAWTLCEKYAKKDAIRTAGLFYVFANHINQSQEDINAYELQQSIYLPIADLELTGLQLLPQKFDEKLQECLDITGDNRATMVRIAEQYGIENFNPNSDAQIRKILFEGLGFSTKGIRKTPGQQYSTDKNTLASLQERKCSFQARRFVKSLTEYASANTALTYLQSYKRFQLNGRLYPNINQVGTSTTRFSSSEPNGQNVGKGKELFDEDGNKVVVFSLREVFGPAPGYVWLSIDYDQLQIRIFAYRSQDPGLIAAIEGGFDFHTVVAKAIFDTDEPTKEQRKRAKYVNFGLLFGAGPDKVNLLAGFSGAYKRFSKLYPHATEYLKMRSNEARRNGFIRTASGYPLTVPRNRPYTAVNYEVQGTEGDIVKNALAKCSHILGTDTATSLYNNILGIPTKTGKIGMQIHDEFLFEFKEDRPIPLRDLVGAMEQSGLDFGVPCKCKPEIIVHDWASSKAIQIDHFESLAT